jgi:proteic killer suppression protein
MAIVDFKFRDTEALFRGHRVARWKIFERAALRKLEQLDWSNALSDLKIPPGNRLEALKGARKGQHSIRINDQWRVCLVWTAGGARHVEIVDYHRG